MEKFIQLVPNILSSFRLVLSFLFPVVPEATWIWLVIGGGGSDALDGWIARRWHVQSKTGAILDAVADKTFVLSALLTISAHGKFSLFLIPLLLARDLLVAGTAIYTASIREWASFQRMDVRWSGKLATIAQFFLLMTAVLWSDKIDFTLWPAILFSVAAAADYGWLFMLELRHRAQKSSS
ncbi:CDP-alcohol phosphatidyltransferase family protein [Desulfobulbus sp. US1]|nr:CDP-alcohol phosphatidyltransferase family protein [Desulfobulbus sp. N2]MCW5209884.1 CDP-alcohol phosphatidyltransferase family protein [Desulfobulbus sp. US1]WLE95878.1 MAG: CDP-alcohol phosphatidyltransferase family protein [Candidatus Electrothrix communis]